jgi:CheY-like chemotaxis protein
MKRALVIEDQKPIRESIGELLEVGGCETRLIGDGQAALEELLNTAYDLITLDLNMPSMDGVSLAETITSQEGPNANTPIIVISAYLSPQVTENLQQLNIKHFLEKPFVAEELLQIVKELLGTD